MDNDGRDDAPTFGTAPSQQASAGRPEKSAPTGPGHQGARTPRPAGDRDRRWVRRAEVATIVGSAVGIVGLVVALFAWLDPKSPGNPAASTPTVAGGTGSSVPGSTAPVVPGATTPSSSTADVRYLAEVRPATGGPFVQTGGKIGQHAMVIRCGTGESDDQFREVAWDLGGHYARFAATATVTGQADPKAQVQVQVLADAVQADRKVLTLGQSASVNVFLTGVQRIALRVTCEFPSMAVTFSEATLFS